MKTKRSIIVERSRRPKRSSMVDKRLHKLLSDFPPTNFSIQPHILLQRNLWYDNMHTSWAPATIKSWLSTPTTRCSRAYQRPQLRHITAGSFKNPNPYLHNHFLYRYNYYCTPNLYSDPFDSKNKVMEFTSLAKSQGKFYATSLQGTLVEMQMLDTRLKITAVGAVRAIPSVPSRVFKEYLVEMKGEILLVFLIHEKSLAVVDNVEVFRLDLDKLDLIKVERLRGSTMILKEKSVWLDSAEFGCRDDCVFFTEGNENKWRVYDMKTCCISSV